MSRNSRLVIAAASAAGMVLALVADRHAQNHYTPGTDRTR
jgi:hypothetical protein